jgi:hypothetical protein
MGQGDDLIKRTLKTVPVKRLLCFLGWHKWTSSISDYIEEFGYVPLDNRIASNSVCERCKVKFKEQ